MVDPIHKAIMEAKKNWNFYEGSHIFQSHVYDPVNIGRWCEIHSSTIHPYTRIGAYCFIADAEICPYVFMAPRVTFCHDPKDFPSGGADWRSTTVKEGARIGAGAIIIGGVTIGENAVIGAGAVVVHDVPDGETWAGNPARRIK